MSLSTALRRPAVVTNKRQDDRVVERPVQEEAFSEDALAHGGRLFGRPKARLIPVLFPERQADSNQHERQKRRWKARIPGRKGGPTLTPASFPNSD